MKGDIVMKKKIFSVFTAFVYVVILFVGCSFPSMVTNEDKELSNPAESQNDIVSSNESKDFTVSSEGEEYAIRFTDRFKESLGKDDFLLEMVATNYPKFSSVADMKKRIETADIPINELAFFYADNGMKDVVQICDLSNLYDIKLPQSTSLERILFMGNSYCFEFSSKDCEGYLDYFNNEEDYTRQLAERHIDQLREDFIILSDDEVNDRDARVVNFKTGLAELKRIYYTIDNANGNMYVCESYVLKYLRENSPLETSSTVPQKIYIYGTNDGAKFFGVLFDLKERPTLEWLSSFGLEKVDAMEAS